ncbi:glycine cleavage T protein (aminomethyl transferase) [Shewanella sediminis HAW-EB3]|uniref:Glycine cleavage T protein (Aminomethyl transferase) n=1 Tax=Shewanella sediminis (strain HAW-EB3) TaxID=425104 RepID=A8G0C9_SHESH|nr:tRNA-modifying protein YgfZ [Shewanella sediminis]ABV38552.1 glycine cleavage T protein (aminomethyl transferase) [Shewanella sediminis HAW-EB3]
MTTSVSQLDWNLNDPLPSLVFSDLTHLGLMSITGEQGRSFIHGQVTTDISSLEKDQWCWGAHCDPKGKMWASFRTFAIEDTLFMMMPSDTLEVDLPQLAKYAVFSKAELTNVSSDWLILGVAGEQAQEWVNNYFGDIDKAVTEIPGGALLKDGSRFIIVIEKTPSQALLTSINAPIYECKVWQALEIQSGYPNLAAAHQGHFVPQMCNLQAIGGISFEKGCYMGQETVARMKYRGGNKRALYILSGNASEAVTLESKLELALEDGFKTTGTIIEVVQSGEQVLLTAVLPNDTENSASLRLTGDESSSLTIQPLPYSLEDEA